MAGRIKNYISDFLDTFRKIPEKPEKPLLKKQLIKVRVPQLPDESTGWRMYPAFKGRTPNLEFISCHSSVLSPGNCPHPPHMHKEEEILILLQGEVDLVIPGEDQQGEQKRIRLLPGQFVYYPAFYSHTLETASSYPANYMMFKWYSEPSDIRDALSFLHIEELDPLGDAEISKLFTTKLNFNGSTSYCKKLHSHTTYLLPNGGYKKHKDLHDVAIVMLNGTAVTNGVQVKPFDIIFYPAGELHDMHNNNDKSARYLVFEFHGHR